uniref:Adrenomedullin 5 (putative) n=1 Tax=Aotus nancymaae TaxID=37293 RepID=A0A2K5CEN3_AOTNA
MTAHILLLLLLLAFSAQGDPDSAARRGQHQDALQHREHLWSLGVRQTHRLLEIIHWIRALGKVQPRAPGPLQLWAPAAVAQGRSPAQLPGLWLAARGPALCPARWVTSGTAGHRPGFSLPALLPHVSSLLIPAPETVFPSPSPGCD